MNIYRIEVQHYDSRIKRWCETGFFWNGCSKKDALTAYKWVTPQIAEYLSEQGQQYFYTDEWRLIISWGSAWNEYEIMYLDGSTEEGRLKDAVSD